MRNQAAVATLFVVALVSLAGAGNIVASGRLSAEEPIVGLWERSDGRQTRVTALAGSGFAGQIVKQSHTCFPAGTTVWRIQRSGTSYTGQTLYRNNTTCADVGWAASTWALTGANTLRHCGGEPDGSNYGCVDYRRVAARDTLAPTAKALAVKGTAGKPIRLPYQVSDDSGSVSVTIKVFRNTWDEIFAPPRLPLHAVDAGTTYTYDWTIPDGEPGPLRFSVQARDAAGNTSPASYAKIALTGARVSCSGTGRIVAGTTGDDVLTGGAGRDTICGGPGNDVISGLDGNDRLDGGEGNDTIMGGTGDDWITGGPGSDRIFGDRGDDTIEDHQPNSKDRDFVNGGPGHDYALTTAKYDLPTISVERKRVCGQIFAGAQPPDCRTYGG